ncbi:hypothetical protein HK102_012908, partial [Quaeritorhiza haematococci]
DAGIQGELADRVVSEGLSRAEALEAVRVAARQAPAPRGQGRGAGRPGKVSIIRTLRAAGCKITVENRNGVDDARLVAALREALDRPGEWFLDRDGTLTYKPLPGEEIGKSRFVAPVAGAFLAIQGDPDKGAFVEDLAFRGLTFRHAAYNLPAEGHADPQAAASVPAVVQVDGARRVALEGCRIEHVGVYGVWFRRGCTDCKV